MELLFDSIAFIFYSIFFIKHLLNRFKLIYIFVKNYIDVLDNKGEACKFVNFRERQSVK
jgi:hypothetical protein